MKNKILPLLTLLLTANLVCSTAYAATVDVNSAKTVATNFYSGNSNKAITNITLAFTETASDGSPAYYVFNVNSNDGFVIVTADDAAIPVIGYSSTGHYNVSTVIPPLATLLQNRAQQVSYIKANKLPATQKTSAQWHKWQTQTTGTTRSREGSVGPLCSTTWNQQAGYNALCPGNSPTGCTATTIAQIMKYWSYPPHGTGSFSYNDSIKYGFTKNYGIQSADFGNTTYDWAAMPDNVISGNAEVDTLMYQCGVSLGMDYNPEGSNSNITFFDSVAWRDPCGGTVCAQTALAEYFGYDSASMQGLQKADYADSTWDMILENELNNNRVIQYAGYTDNTKLEGHTWVCDGYDVNNNFYMNWGWGGDYDGYFSLDYLHTDIVYNFGYAQEALIGIQPASQSIPTGVKETLLQATVSVYPNPTTGRVTIYNAQAPVTGVEVYNVVGDKVFQSTGDIANKSFLDLSLQPAGVYFIRLQEGEGAQTMKLVKE